MKVIDQRHGLQIEHTGPGQFTLVDLFDHTAPTAENVFSTYAEAEASREQILTTIFRDAKREDVLAEVSMGEH